MVAATTELELVQPQGAQFEHIRYPDSFRLTTTQLIDDGTTALQLSYVNFERINQSVSGVHPIVLRIIKLLAAPKDGTPEQNAIYIQKYLPPQIDSLEYRMDTCLRMAEEIDKVFSNYLKLVEETDQLYRATQGAPRSIFQFRGVR